MEGALRADLCRFTGTSLYAQVRYGPNWSALHKQLGTTVRTIMELPMLEVRLSGGRE